MRLSFASHSFTNISPLITSYAIIACSPFSRTTYSGIVIYITHARFYSLYQLRRIYIAGRAYTAELIVLWRIYHGGGREVLAYYRITR